MVRRKAMIMLQTFLIITAICLGTPSEAGTSCIWCDDYVSLSFMNCLTRKMADNPNFKDSAASMEGMKTDLIEAAKAMKIKGPTKELAMKGALSYGLADVIGTNGDLDKKISDITNIIQWCYKDVGQQPDVLFLDESGKTIKIVLAEKEKQLNAQQPRDQMQPDKILQFRNSNAPQQQAAAISYANADTFPSSQQKDQQYSLLPDKQQLPLYNNAPQRNAAAISYADAHAFPLSQQKGQPNTFLPDKQQFPQFNSVPQQQESASTAGADILYSNQGNNQWNGFPYNKPKPQGQYYFQPSGAIPSGAKNFAFSTIDSYIPPYGGVQQQPVLPNFWNVRQNQPFNPLNNYNSQGNQYAYQNGYQGYLLKNTKIQDYPDKSGIWNSGQPGNQPGWSNTEANAASFANSDNGSQNNKDYVPHSDSFASAASQTTYYETKKNYDYSPNYPSSYAAASSSASSLVANNGGNNAAGSASPGSYSIENSDQKPSLLNISKRKRKQKPLLIPNNEPQTDTSQQNSPSTIDDETAKCLKFSGTLYMVLRKDDSFKNVFHEYTTKLQSKQMVNYMLISGLRSCGYDPQTTQKMAESSMDFMEGFPEGSPTAAYAQGICKMVMVMFNKLNLIGNDPDGQAKALGNAMIAALKKIEGPSPTSQDKDNKAGVPLTSQQKPSVFPTKNIEYDGSYPNYDAANTQVKPDSFPNKPLNPQPELLNNDSYYPVPQTQSIQKQEKLLNAYSIVSQPTDDKPISYDRQVKPAKNGKDNNESSVSTDGDDNYDGYVEKYKDNQPIDDKFISYDTPASIKLNKNDKTNDKFPVSTDGDYNFGYIEYFKDEDGYDSSSQIQNTEKQPNTNDNSGQLPDGNPITYDESIKDKDKKYDQPRINDKTADISYDGNKQLSTDKPVSIKKDKGGDTSSGPFVGSTDKDGDYGDYSYDYDYYGYDDFKDEAKDDDINPYDYLMPNKKQNPTNGDVKDESSKDKPKQQTDILINKNTPKNNKQADDYPYTNAPDDNSNLKTFPKSKELVQQNDKSNPIYLPDYDKDDLQNPSEQLPPTTPANPQFSESPDIGQKEQKDKSNPLYLPDNNNDGLQKPSKQLPPPVVDDQQISKSTDIGQKNLDFKKADNSESKDRVKFLMKWALDCIKGGKFDYNTYSSIIAATAKGVQQTHPEWGAQKSQTTVLIETIFGLTQLLLKSKIKDVKDTTKQLQKTANPIQLPPNNQQIYPNVPQNNQNPSYQIWQKNENPPPVKQDKPNVDYIAPDQSIVYPPQNPNAQQNNWDNNQNLYPEVQNIPIMQSEPVNTYPVPQQAILQQTVPEQTVPKQTVPQQTVPQQTVPIAPQNAAQDNNWKAGNQAWPNNKSPMNNNNANFQLVEQPLLIPGQMNTNQEDWNLNDKTFLLTQIGNSNTGSSSFQYPLGKQAIFPGLRQGDVTNPGFSQNGNEGSYAQSSAIANSAQSGNKGFNEDRGNWAAISNGPSNPSPAQTGNKAFTRSQGNLAPMPNGPSNPSLEQTGNRAFTGSQGNWAPILNAPINPKLAQDENPVLTGSQGKWAPISNAPINTNLAQGGNLRHTGSQDWASLPNAPINPNLAQGGNLGLTRSQGNWAPMSNTPINPSLIQTRNKEFTGGQSNSAFKSNDPSNIGFSQNVNQGNWPALQQNDFMQTGNQGFGGASQIENFPQRNQWIYG